MTGNIVHSLMTNEALTPAQEWSVRSEISSLDFSLGELDEEIYRLWDQIQLLRARRANVVARKTAFKAFLSPLRNLPAEVLAGIFLLVVFEDDALITVHFNSISPTVQRLASLSLVCKKWTRVIRQTPHLWSAIDLRESGGVGMEAAQVVPHLRAHFSRCGSLPWALSFSSDRVLDLDGGLLPATAATALISFVKTSNRWKTLSFTHQNLDVLAPLFSQEKGTSAVNWPELESFYLKGWYYGAAQVQPFVNTTSAIYIGTLPRLTSLTLHTFDQRVSNWKLPWAQLTVLCLTTADSYADNIQILKRCTQLVVCDVSLPTPSWSSSDIELDRIVASRVRMPHLKTLKIRHSTEIGPFFRAITLPKLECLTVDAVPQQLLLHHRTSEEFSAGQALTDFLARSKCTRTLRHLALHNLPLNDTHYVGILRQTTSLEVLHITESGCGAGLWVGDVNQEALVPEVKVVTIRGQFALGTHGRRYLNEFLRARGGLLYDEDGPFYCDGATLSEDMFEWSLSSLY